MSKVAFKVKHYFDGVYMYLGVLFAMLGLIFMILDVVVALVFLFLTLLVFSTIYKLAIYKDEKIYHDYLWIFGLKKGKKYTFESIDKLVMTKGKYKQRFNSRGSTTVIEYDIYKAYIVFDQDKKILIGESKNAAKVEKQVAKLRDKLGLEVDDLRSS